MLPPDQSADVRPLRRVRALCALLAIMGVAHLVGAGRALAYGAEYPALGVRVSPVVTALAGAGWGGALLWLSAGLWQGRNRSGRAVFLVLGLYGLFQIVWWRATAGSDYALARWPFAALLMILWTGGALWAGLAASRSPRSH